MTSLQQLDALFCSGAAGLPAELLAGYRRYVLAAAHPDGGFGGRQGPSDLYYTDFALRLLNLTGDGGEALAKAAGFLRGSAAAPRDLPDVFCLLNAARLSDVAVDGERTAAMLAAHAVPSGGYAKSPGGPPSAYVTFLAALCHEMLTLPFPGRDEAVAVLVGLQGPGGGFRDLAGDGPEQTNATAAAVGALGLLLALDETVARRAASFLGARQARDGGLTAHAGTDQGDLLSTFTGLVALTGLPADATLDLAALTRFVRARALPGGRFSAMAGDLDGDLEYTYYGVALLCLLRVLLPA